MRVSALACVSHHTGGAEGCISAASYRTEGETASPSLSSIERFLLKLSSSVLPPGD